MKLWEYCLTLLLPAAHSLGGEVRYRVTPIFSTISADTTISTSINDQGEISAYTYDAVSIAFIEQDGHYRTISAARGENYDRLMQLNNAGEGIGFNDKSGQGLVWNGTSFSVLAKLSGAKAFNYFPTGLNNNGDIVGVFRGFEWKDGIPTDLATPVAWHDGVPKILSTPAQSDYTIAAAINDEGLIVGSSSGDDERSRPIIWQNGQVKTLPMLDGDFGEAVTVNNQGVIAGLSETVDDVMDAVDWHNSHLSDLGPAENIGGMNNSNQIVGEYQNLGVIWENGKRFDLNTLIPHDSGWQLLGASAINDQGQIVGEGRFQGHERGYLLTPISPSAIPLPAPLATGLVTSPLMFFAMRRSMRRRAAS